MTIIKQLKNTIDTRSHYNKMPMYVYVCMYVCIYVCMQVCMYVRIMHVCDMSVCTFACIHMCMYVCKVLYIDESSCGYV